METDSDDSLSRDDRIELEESGFIVDHPDHEAVQRIAVDDWEHVDLRITGLADHMGESDGMDINLGQFVTDNSVIELNVNGEVMSRLVQVD